MYDQGHKVTIGLPALNALRLVMLTTVIPEAINTGSNHIVYILAKLINVGYQLSSCPQNISIHWINPQLVICLSRNDRIV